MYTKTSSKINLKLNKNLKKNLTIKQKRNSLKKKNSLNLNLTTIINNHKYNIKDLKWDYNDYEINNLSYEEALKKDQIH